jgi:hypothetical protein
VQRVVFFFIFTFFKRRERERESQWGMVAVCTEREHDVVAEGGAAEVA